MTLAGDLLMAVNEAKAKYTIKNLLDSTKKLRDKINKPPRIAVVEMKPVPRNNTLIVKAQAHGTRLYDVTLIVYDVRYASSQDRTHQLTVMLGDGEYAYAGFILKNKNPVQVRCNCPDFYFTWQHWDSQVKALSGPNKPKYVRKTDHYPERNPLHVPGVCKHLVGLFMKLQGDKILR